MGMKSGLGSLDLPPELLYAIYDEIENLRDTICLALTNKLLYEVGKTRIDELVSKATAQWAGDRVICVGDYMRNDDLPDGMLTKAELQDLCGNKACSNEEDEDSGRLSLYDAAGHFKTVRPINLLGTRFYYRLHYRERSNFYMLSEPNYSASDGLATEWVLCNISKHEYVRADAAAALTGSSAGNLFGTEQIGLGEVLLSRICWSSDPSVSTRYEGGLHRGAWAGDRFEITTIERMRPLKDNEEWKDVTKEVLEEVVNIWNAEFED